MYRNLYNESSTVPNIVRPYGNTNTSQEQVKPVLRS